MNILKYPHQCLTQSCAEIPELTPEIHNLAVKMLAKMYTSEGIGLAAPQVGSMLRLFVIDISMDGDQPFVFINPILEPYGKIINSGEGCLSIPGFTTTVQRFENVKVTYTNLSNEQKTIDATGLLARCIQHENDHLNGRMFIDHLSKLKKSMLLKKLTKMGKYHG